RAKRCATINPAPTHPTTTASASSLSLCYCILRTPRATLFPYTTLFRSSGNLHAYGLPGPPPPPGTTLGQDTFHRANQTLWGTASVGNAQGCNANTSRIFSINNNAGQVATGSGPHSEVLGPTATDAEVLF